MNNVIRFPTKEEEEAALKEFFARESRVTHERVQAVLSARDSLTRLCEVLRGRSGQPYKLRQILYSLWNGKPASLVEVVGLDWEIRKDLCQVMLAFGYEDEQNQFFYSAIENAVEKAGQWHWFLEERLNVEQLAEYVAAAKEAS